MVMIYFSGTGNSEYIAKSFASKMDIPSHSIEEKIDFERVLQRARTIAVCYPIYGSCVPRIMREFTAKYKEILDQKKLIIFCTQMMYSGDGARAYARLLPGCDNRVIYAEHFNMPNNISNFFLFPITERERIRKKRTADRKLDEVIQDIKNGIIRKRGWSTFATILGKAQNVAWPTLEEKRKGSFRADEDCVQCGRCVKCCPMDNLVIQGKSIMQKNNCILCYRCVNVCPKNAATVMIHTKPKTRYSGPNKEKESR